MDPVTQGALGAAVTLAALQDRSPISTPALALMGWAGGMAADLDILIRSSSDPLLAIEYHRHFTHALCFIPVGGFVTALPFFFKRAWRAVFWWVVVATTIGYATHGLLDACTTYGTQLYWPFSTHRVSLRFVSVIDPLVTVPLLIGVLWAVRKRQRYGARLATAWVIAILSLGALQHHRAFRAQKAMATARGHEPRQSAVFPMFANNMAWRSVYRHGDQYFVDKIRAPWLGKPCVTPGTQVPVLSQSQLSEIAGDSPKTQRAVRLIAWFSSGYVTKDPEDPKTLGDLRYSFSPQEAQPIWGIQVEPKTETVRWINNRHKRALSWHTFAELVAVDGTHARCF